MSKLSVATIDWLAHAYDKPPAYVELCAKNFPVDGLDVFGPRRAGDGLGPFFSALTASLTVGESMTKQEFTEEVDINNIISRFKASGGDPSSLPQTSKIARYGDFSGMPDSYHAALSFITDTNREFLKLDASIRAEFDNDPQQFLSFVQDPVNADRLVEMGLANSPALYTSAEGTVSKSPAPKGGSSASTGSKKPVKGDSSESVGEDGGA